MAFASATHDIAADGFYLHALTQDRQAAFVGVRSLFYRLAMISGQGALVWAAGALAAHTGNVKSAWALVFLGLALLFGCLAFSHTLTLPRPVSDAQMPRNTPWFAEWLETFRSFFQRRDIVLVLAFLLTFRLAEAQIVKLMAPFLLDGKALGGLGMSTQQLGWVYGTIGVAALTLGGILGGLAIARNGLKCWLWPMLLAVHGPNLLYVWLAFTQPDNVWLTTIAVALEQFGYGFGFAAYLMFMMMVADADTTNHRKTAHYSICTGFMALGMMLPGMVSGKIQSVLGYPLFFVWVCACTLPSVCIAWFVKIDPQFGKRNRLQ